MAPLLRPKRGASGNLPHIKAYARFWSSFLTLMFPYLIFVQCYLLYLAVIAEGIAFELTYIYKLGIAELMPLFFMLIGQCAKVVAINNRVLVENRRFFVAYSQLTLRGGGGGDNHGRGYQQFRAQRLMKVCCWSFVLFLSFDLSFCCFLFYSAGGELSDSTCPAHLLLQGVHQLPHHLENLPLDYRLH